MQQPQRTPYIYQYVQQHNQQQQQQVVQHPQQTTQQQTTQQQQQPDIIEQQVNVLHEKFKEFSNKYIGSECVLYYKLTPPTDKEYGVAVYDLQYDLHIKTGLVPFAMPRPGQDVKSLPANMTMISALQYFIDGIGCLMAGRSQCPAMNTNPAASNPMRATVLMYMAKVNLMVSKLNEHLLKLPMLSSSSPTTTAASNPLIDHFKRECEALKKMQAYCYESAPAEPTVKHQLALRLFSLLHCSYWDMPFLDDAERLKHSYPVYKLLADVANENPAESKFIYSMGSFCYSYFQMYKTVYHISTPQFFNFHTNPTFDQTIYGHMLTYLKHSNHSFQSEFDRHANNAEYWFIYAKTCCLLNYEEKAYSWIQLFINQACNRVQLAKIVDTDPDLVPFHTKTWYKEIMKSIEEEEERMLQQQIAQEQQKQIMMEKVMADFESDLIKSEPADHQFELVQSSPVVVGNSGNSVPAANTGAITNNNTNNNNQYNEFKQNIIVDGFSHKNMNNDSMLISSVILLSMTQPPEAKEAELAKKRLGERLNLYMLKNSKEIPGDGNCQMHALSDQLYGDLTRSPEIRKTIVDWLRKNKDFAFPNGATLCQFVNGSWDDYCNEMSKSGIWGDHLTLLAAAEIYKAKISIISSVESTSHFFIEIIPTKIENPKVLLLSHYAEFHYGSLCFMA
ncbi:hypothetical protein SAMD00019534_094580 [Acytostelium subglobosum LB1]|uniref:hypothetical protein n=1 Tax=Acytostelium subglobosum LB1 TaxID=1410327 RepID=UPI000644E088|nr:hypothetical protein SAMD00019534_094580 [Acytostelium subglobosum LB1]GAM26283.1 hypothetical protein SAMD00019534_094580 [Acytostelium subglobosum LB1]|eukprot:XP_012750837.1 hypothetical protein SAMD00019534_094580 [Acytostelium subglobosum LB1]